MKRLNVTSNAIRSIGYDDKERHLEVEFHNGRLGRHTNVPKHTFHDLLNADSIGSHYNENIRTEFAWVPLYPDPDSRAKDEESEIG